VGVGSSEEPSWLIVKVPHREMKLFLQLLQLPYWLIGVTRILLRHKFDFIYVSNDWFGLLVYLIARKLLKLRVIFEIHGILSEESEQSGDPTFYPWLLHCWEGIVLRHCDMIIALSGHIFKFCERYARRLELVPVFVDVNTYRRNEDTRVVLRERYGWQRSWVVGLIGPFDNVWNEGALEFLEKNINEFDERIVFVVIGKCDRKIKLPRCSYVGFVEDLPGFLSGLDAVLVARKLSTSGPLNKIIYSMSCSLPVFTSPQGMLGMDYAEHGKDIIVANESEMARTLNSAIFDHDLMRRIGQKARQTVKKHYSYEANATRLIRIVESLNHSEHRSAKKRRTS
jgi:glycosyltransferase involved in cell wall biosynthesis